jgi:hypothetical protein
MSRVNRPSSDEQKRSTSLVVQAYRQRLGWKTRPLSFPQFAEQLNQYTAHLGLSVSYQTIKNWADGRHRPDYFFIQQLANHAPAESWQHAFAMDMLAVQWPELHQPGSEIGANIIRSTLSR